MRKTQIYTKESQSLSDIRISKRSCLDRVEGHMHDFVELVYITSGYGVQYIGGSKYKVAHGDLLFINYGQTHSFETDKSFEFVNILINPSFISRELVNSENIEEIFTLSLFEEFGSSTDFTRQAVSFKGGDRKRMDEIISAMLTEQSDERQGSKSVLRGYLQVVFSMLLRGISEIAKIDDGQIENLPDDIAAYIEENCFDRISLADIAAMSFYNPAYFGRLLKKRYGKTFSAYIKEKRMERAAELLCDRGRTVEDVICAVGYSDRKLFYKHFKEYFGKTPSEYRK